MKNSIFREYDIRGIVGSEFIIEESYNLGQAIITHLLSKNPAEKRIIIGRDNRQSSPTIQEELTKAACDAGLSVIDIGIVPSPVMYFATHHLSCNFGLVITASHNPEAYNGIKIWGCWGSEIQTIKNYYEQREALSKLESLVKEKDYKEKSCGNKVSQRKTKDDIKNTETYDIITPYINYLTEAFSHLKNKKMNVVIDCGHGTGSVIYPRLIKALALQETKLLCASLEKPHNAHQADPTVPENMQDVAQLLAEESTFNLGIGLDGDCDRMTPMTKEGKLVYGDLLLGLFAQDLLEEQPNATIICDIKSSGALLEYLDEKSAHYYLSPSGHSIIKEQMIAHNALLAGELSCHFFFKDRYFGYDDGIYASLRLLELLDKKQASLEKLLTIFPTKKSSPEIRLVCHDDAIKKTIIKNSVTFFAARPYLAINTIDGVRVTQSYGWGLIRASNTQPVVCLRFESTTDDGFNRIKNDFIDALAPHFDKALLDELITKNYS